jgi:hypothetical protein
LILGLAITACADPATGTDPLVEPPAPKTPIAGIVVSNATPLAAAATASVAAGESYAYVSLPPGTVSDGVDITISNRRTGSSRTVGLVDGGVDPVAMAAESGDTLDIAITRLTGSPVQGTEVVKPRRPPIIVRTVPPRGKRDVPLNTRILVVFSEPMDTSSLTAGAVQLLLDGASVSGALEFSDPARTTITLTPATTLESTRSYTVRVTSNARDLDGQTLEVEWVGDFATMAVNAPPAQLTSTRVGDMVRPRSGHTATLLNDGRVLITGGYVDIPGATGQGGATFGSTTAELYDPATRTFTSTGSMLEPRAAHQAVLLPNGEVLIVGGNQYQERAELYDPITGIFRASDAMRPEKRLILSATLLRTGEVLIIGWYYASLFNPATGQFRDAGAYASPFYTNEAVTLQDGRVLLAGDTVSQIYDPSTDTFRRGPATGYIAELNTLTVLPDGRVLMAGGMEMGRYAWARLYDPITDSFTATSDMHFARDAHGAAVLPDGRVLIAGGDGWDCSASNPYGTTCFFSGSLASVEIFDPVSQRFELGPDMRFARTLPRATRLNSGDVLITGGFSYCGIGCYLGPLASAELYQMPLLSTRRSP